MLNRYTNKPNGLGWKAYCSELSQQLVKAMAFAELIRWCETTLTNRDTYMDIARKYETLLHDLSIAKEPEKS